MMALGKHRVSLVEIVFDPTIVGGTASAVRTCAGSRDSATPLLPTPP
jgi:hypothetical protein